MAGKVAKFTRDGSDGYDTLKWFVIRVVARG